MAGQCCVVTIGRVSVKISFEVSDIFKGMGCGLISASTKQLTLEDSPTLKCYRASVIEFLILFVSVFFYKFQHHKKSHCYVSVTHTLQTSECQ